MNLQLPDIAQLRDIAAQYGFRLTDADLESFRGLMTGSLQSYQRVAEMDHQSLPRTTRARPATGLPRPRIRSTPGIGKPRSRAQPTVRCTANASSSRTTPALLACR
jgi:hypothetical protein